MVFITNDVQLCGSRRSNKELPERVTILVKQEQPNFAT